MAFTISQKGVDLIKQFEGLRLTAYYDTGNVLTIGYGTTNTILPAQYKIKAGQVITKDQAEKYLAYGVDNVFSPKVNSMVKVNITQEQFDALVCFAYNCGPDNLASSTLLRKLNVGDVFGTQKEFLRWDKDNGKRLLGLTRRRLAEATLFGPATREQLIKDCLNGVDPK